MGRIDRRPRPKGDEEVDREEEITARDEGFEEVELADEEDYGPDFENEFGWI